MSVLFWASLALLAMTYLGYPVLMLSLARLRPRPVRTVVPDAWKGGPPRIEALMVVHDGAEHLAAKIENLLALDYPTEHLHLTVVCDGCRDDSEAIARAADPSRVRVLAFPERRGKSACLGAAIPTLDADLVLFVDVRQRLDAGAAQALAAVFADPEVGAASGELMLEDASGYGAGIDAYWRLEKTIRRAESVSGSAVGVTGALYMARRALLPEVPGGLILDDLWIPLAIARTGARVLFVDTAKVYDRAATDPAIEERRKRRTLAGNYQLLHRWPSLALPGGHPLVWRLWGHKWLRLLAPWLLVAALLSNLALATTSPWYALALAGQGLGYTLALAGRLFPALTAIGPVRIAGAFLSLNLSAARALFDHLRNPNGHLWATTAIKRASP